MHFNKIPVLSLLLVIVFAQCTKKGMYTDSTYFHTKVLILGHRGMGIGYYKPGNTYESIVPALGIGVDGCEIDIQMTKDSVLVLFHDTQLNSSTSCFGKVHDHTWEEMKSCEYVSLHKNIYVNSLDELLSKLPDLTTLYFSLDCKTDDQVQDPALYRLKFLRAIKRVCDKFHMADNILIEGDRDFLQKAKVLGLTNKLFLAAALSEESIMIASADECFGISASMESLADNVPLAHLMGIRVMAWSPDNCSENKEMLGQSVDIIQTDDPKSLLKFLERYNYEYTIP